MAQVVEEVLQAKDAFEVLGLEPRLHTCSTAEDACKRLLQMQAYGHQDFKTAKNIRCLNVHPDKCEHQAAQQAFQKVMVAWSTLENAQSRQDYVGKLMQAAQTQTA